jgi:hypothetical protein
VKKFDTFFGQWRLFGKRCTDLANGAQIWQMAHRFGKWYTDLANLNSLITGIDEIER